MTGVNSASAAYLRRAALLLVPDPNPPYACRFVLGPKLCRFWPPYQVDSVTMAGSWGKGTSTRGTSDVDLFVSFSQNCGYTTKQLYGDMLLFARRELSSVRKQNVSIGGNLGGAKVDLVPAKRHSRNPDDHSLYLRTQDTWTKTNIAKQTAYVRRAGLTDEIRLLKYWRSKYDFDVTSFAIELIAIQAIECHGRSDLLGNFVSVMTYIRDQANRMQLSDPGNLSNNVADELTTGVRNRMAEIAYHILRGDIALEHVYERVA